MASGPTPRTVSSRSRRRDDDSEPGALRLTMAGPGDAGPRVIGLVAAHNEAATVARVVSALHAMPAISEVIVVADGSTDRTAEEASAAGAWVWIAPGRMGKGRALDAALDWAGPADAFLLVDADVGETASRMEALLAEVLAGKADLAIGRLPPTSGGGFGLVKRTSRWAIRRLAGFDALEPLSGQRAVSAPALQACRPLARGFGVETAMTIDALRLGFRVREAPVAMRHRPTGRGFRGFLHRARQGIDILSAALPRALHLR
jgi:hypothetical protein